jgi:hypothetical protein
MVVKAAPLTPLDPHGRFVSLPPNSAANAHFLSMLRYLLVQDFDFSDDGQPETLRLCFATPRRWLEDGKRIRVERAPTAFGPVSLSLSSHLAQGEVLATVEQPQRKKPETVLLRARVPDGWHVVSAQAGSRTLRVDDKGTVDLSALTGSQTIRFAVKHQ